MTSGDAQLGQVLIVSNKEHPACFGSQRKGEERCRSPRGAGSCGIEGRVKKHLVAYLEPKTLAYMGAGLSDTRTPLVNTHER